MKRTNLQSTRIDWKSVIDRAKEELQWFEENEIKPAVRTLFYRLVSLEVIPNTKQAYKSFDEATVEARIDGRLAWSVFSDATRLLHDDFPDTYYTPEEHIQAGIDHIKNAPQDYIKTVPRWHEQPHYVEVWLEKQALAATFQLFLQDRHVRIAVNRGYPSWTFLHENCMRLQEKKDEGKKIHVLYFGDFDPSGDDIDRHLKKALRVFNLEDIDFKRIAVTPEQVTQYKFPHRPRDENTKAKLENDTRTNGFIEKYRKLYAVELDAMSVKIPKELKSIVPKTS